MTEQLEEEQSVCGPLTAVTACRAIQPFKNAAVCLSVCPTVNLHVCVFFFLLCFQTNNLISGFEEFDVQVDAALICCSTLTRVACLYHDPLLNSLDD